MKWNVAVVGATGVVGEQMIAMLANLDFVQDIVPVASSRSAGSEIVWRDTKRKVVDLASFDFSTVDCALFSAGGEISKQYVPKACAAGCLVIDNTSTFRYQNDVPLIVPEVNAHALPKSHKGSLISNPNCSTIAMLLAIAPMHRAFGIKHVDVATYQAVSGAGRSAVDALRAQSVSGCNELGPFDAPIAFNCIPHIDVAMDNGYSKEEMKMHWETQKMLEDNELCVSATCVRVPVYVGHGQALHVEFKQGQSRDKIEQVLLKAPGVTIAQHHWQPTSQMAAGVDDVIIGRLRAHHTMPERFAFWLVGDNVRKGAALNSVQILEAMHKKSGRL